MYPCEIKAFKSECFGSLWYTPSCQSASLRGSKTIKEEILYHHVTPLISKSQSICFLPPKIPLFCVFHTVCDLWCLTSLNWLLCERYIRTHFLLLLNNIPLDENSCVWALGSSYFLAILNVWLLFIVWLGFFSACI